MKAGRVVERVVEMEKEVETGMEKAKAELKKEVKNEMTERKDRPSNVVLYGLDEPNEVDAGRRLEGDKG